MATSPIYNWPEPDNSDLVKNGALAIRTLGNAIDTTMATMVPKTIVDAKGDLIAGTAADTAARLAVGNNGETLVADSSTSTGLRYNPSQAAGKNYAINGAFDIWQRGTTQTYTGAAATGFIADRWGSYTTNSGTASRDTTLIQADSQYALRWTSTTASGGNLFLQSVETANAVQLAGKTVTLTVYVAGTVGKSPSIALGYSTTTDLGPVNAFTDITATSGTTTVTSSGTYQKLSAVFAVPSTAKTLRISLATGTLNNTEYINFSQCQLELGSVATAFTRTGGTIQGELAACQRYYWRPSDVQSATAYGVGFTNSTTTAPIFIAMPVAMRTKPSSVEYSTLAVSDQTTYDLAVSNLVISQASTTSANLTATHALTGVAFRPAFLKNNNNTAGYIAFSAEL